MMKLSRTQSTPLERTRKLSSSDNNLNKQIRRDGNPESNNRRQRRKDGLAGFMPQVRSELTRFLTTRRKISKKSDLSFSDDESIQRKNANEKRSNLHIAVHNSDLEEITKYLSKTDVNVNEVDSRGNTALHEAAADGNLDCMKLLLEYGADINQTDNEGRTSLDYAVLAGHFECSTFLIERGAQTENVRNGFLNLRRMTIV